MSRAHRSHLAALGAYVGRALAASLLAAAGLEGAEPGAVAGSSHVEQPGS